MPKKKKSYPRRGLASMSPEERHRIASLGGKAAHAQKKAHEFTKEEAAAAGRKGGIAAHKNGKAHKYTATTGRTASKKRHRKNKKEE